MDQITTALPAAVIWNQELNQTIFLTAIRKLSTTPRNFQIELKAQMQGIDFRCCMPSLL
jgi:hypothetical protein